MNRRSTPQLVLCSLVPLLLVAACASRPTPTQPPTPVNAATAAPPTATTAPTATPIPTPTLDPSIDPLTGQTVADAAALQHRPILVRYGNDRIARPPSGLGSADMVFEELAEGGFITRITGAYLSTLPETVGPIRSARPVVIDLMQQLDAALVYAGASIGTTQLLDQQPYPQYAHVGRGGDLFFRSPAKPAPHNLYLGLPALRERMIADKADKPVELRGLAFAAGAPTGSPAGKIYIAYPGEAPVAYAYEPTAGVYQRYVEGVPYTDALTGKQLAPANVIIVYAEHKNSSIVEDTLGNVALLINLVGKGRVQVFRDGVMVEGSWQRDQPAQLMRYVAADGADIALRPGQSWVQIVPTDYQIKVE